MNEHTSREKELNVNTQSLDFLFLQSHHTNRQRRVLDNRSGLQASVVKTSNKSKVNAHKRSLCVLDNGLSLSKRCNRVEQLNKQDVCTPDSQRQAQAE
jgi:hypothetical protein